MEIPKSLVVKLMVNLAANFMEFKSDGSQAMNHMRRFQFLINFRITELSRFKIKIQKSLFLKFLNKNKIKR